jgi:hypothetical protein
MKHKHAELIHLWADGADIEVEFGDGSWIDDTIPCWHYNSVYRVKPEPDVVMSTRINSSGFGGICVKDMINGYGHNIKLIFNGKTKELKGCEFIPEETK